MGRGSCSFQKLRSPQSEEGKEEAAAPIVHEDWEEGRWEGRRGACLPHSHIPTHWESAVRTTQEALDLHWELSKGSSAVSPLLASKTGVPENGRTGAVHIFPKIRITLVLGEHEEQGRESSCWLNGCTAPLSWNFF